jgi:RNA methyltransferase, TrmH family
MVDPKCIDRLQPDAEATLARATKLHQNRADRDRTGLFYIEGVRNFVRVVDNRFELETILFSEKLLTAPVARKLVRQARRAGIPTLNLSPERFRQISHTERASGIAAIVRQRWSKLSAIQPRAGLCWVALETVRSAGNLGTLIRTAEAVGAAGFMLIGDRVDPFDPDIIRASMGGIFCQQFVRTSLPLLGDWLQQQQCQSIGASPDGIIDLHHFDYPASTLLFLGEERQGLTPQQRELCQHLVRIPMQGDADSLNLGVAGSLLLYEIYRSNRASIA